MDETGKLKEIDYNVRAKGNLYYLWKASLLTRWTRFVVPLLAHRNSSRRLAPSLSTRRCWLALRNSRAGKHTRCCAVEPFSLIGEIEIEIHRLFLES